MKQPRAYEYHLCIASYHQTKPEIHIRYGNSLSFKRFITNAENHVIMFLAQLVCKQLQGGDTSMWSIINKHIQECIQPPRTVAYSET